MFLSIDQQHFNASVRCLANRFDGLANARAIELKPASPGLNLLKQLQNCMGAGCRTPLVNCLGETGDARTSNLFKQHEISEIHF